MIIMDTCAIIWDALDTGKLTPIAKQAINRADSARELIICDISFWEIAMLIRRKRLIIEDTATGFLDLVLGSRNIQVQPITANIAEYSVNFSSKINGDPADRLIAATSVSRNAAIVTADQNLRDSQLVETIW